MLMRFDPFRQIDPSVFDKVTEQLWGTGVTGRGVAMDAFRRGEHVVVRFDLPGADPGSIDLEVERNVLTLRAERPDWRQEGDELIVSERPRGTFTRQLFLGETLDTGAIEANYEHGVLTVTIPVAEQAKPRKVTVSAGDGRPESIETTSSAA
jgi:HSP20 family protein